MRFQYGCATDVGRKRSQNQDSVKSDPELGLFLVADGMGGHRGGEIASRMVVEIVPEIVREARAQHGTQFNPKAAISRAIETASRAIFERALQDPALHGMGTTAVAGIVHDGVLTLGHVGDSRCYFLRPDSGAGSIWQATRDHSLVQEKLRAGLITRADLKTDKSKNVITRSVGFEPHVQVETYEMTVLPGDILMFCSDGLSGMVDDEEILDWVQKARDESTSSPAPGEGGAAHRAVELLIEAANRNGGEDNVSTIVVEIL